MAAWGGYKVLTATIATSASISTAIPIDGWNRLAIELPTFSSGCVSATANVYLQATNDAASGTFRRVQVMGFYSGSSGIYDWEVPASTGNKIVVCEPALNFAAIKVELSISATAAAYGAKIHVGKY